MFRLRFFVVSRNGWQWSTDCRMSWTEAVRRIAKSGCSFGRTNFRFIAAIRRSVTQQPDGRSAHTVYRWLRRLPFSWRESWFKMTGLVTLTSIFFWVISDYGSWLSVPISFAFMLERESESGPPVFVLLCMYIFTDSILRSVNLDRIVKILP